MTRWPATLLLICALNALACASHSRIASDSVSVVPEAMNASALKMGCFERGFVASPDLVPNPDRHCTCEALSLTRLTRAEAVAAIRVAASKLGANVVWLRSEWLEQWEAVHCSNCAVTQYRLLGVAYACDPTTKASIPGE